LKLGKAKNALETAHLDGRAEALSETAKTMLSEGFDVATVARITKLTIKDVEALQH
jgi:predicted transposase/invertase (TIGR01784 family)